MSNVPKEMLLVCCERVGSVEPANYYCTMLEMVRGYLDGNIETTQYEEQLREMYGIYAYVGFTFDKLVQNIVRQVSCFYASLSVCLLREMYGIYAYFGFTCSRW